MASQFVTLSSAGEKHDLAVLHPPPGIYVLSASLRGQTGDDGGGTDFRYDCDITNTGLYWVDRVGQTNASYTNLSYLGTVSLGPVAPPLTFQCLSADNHALTVYELEFVATRVGALN